MLGTTATELNTERSYRSKPGLAAYARIFDDARRGDESQFARADVVEQGWRVVDQVVEHRLILAIHPRGSAGPDVALEDTDVRDV